MITRTTPKSKPVKAVLFLLSRRLFMMLTIYFIVVTSGISQDHTYIVTVADDGGANYIEGLPIPGTLEYALRGIMNGESDFTNIDNITFNLDENSRNLTIPIGGYTIDRALAINGDINNDGEPDITLTGGDSTTHLLLIEGESDEPIEVSLHGLTFDGYQSYAGLIRSRSNQEGRVKLTIAHSVFDNNQSTIQGVNEANEQINLAARDRASGCISFLNDGVHGELTINHTTFSHNKSEYGSGAILFLDEKGILKDGTRSVTTTDPRPLGRLFIDNCIFENNEVGEGLTIGQSSNDGAGGAITMSPDTVRIGNSRFAFNKSLNSAGGAIYFVEFGDLDVGDATLKGNGLIQNTIFFKNQSVGSGAALFISMNGTLQYVNCTITDNVCSSSMGCGLYVEYGTTYLKNSLIVHNLYSGGGAAGSGLNLLRLNNRLLKEGSIIGGEPRGGASDSWPETGYFTDPENDDYTLRLNSLAADAGDNVLSATLPIDLAGNVRPFRPGIDGYEAVVDVGAFELQSIPDKEGPSTADVEGIGVTNRFGEVVRLRVTGTASDENGVAGISVAVRGVVGQEVIELYRGSAFLEESNWSIDIPADALLRGDQNSIAGQTYGVYVTGTDQLGNSSTTNYGVGVPIPTLPNGNCEGALAMEVQSEISVPLQYTQVDADAIQNCAGDPFYQGFTLWYVLEGDGAEMTLALTGGSTAVTMDIFDGTDCVVRTCVAPERKTASGAFQTTTFSSVEGQSYFLRISGDPENFQGEESRELVLYSEAYVVSVADDGADREEGEAPVMGTFERALQDLAFDAYDHIVFDASLSGQQLDIHTGDYTIDRSLTITGHTNESDLPDVTITSDSDQDLLTIAGESLSPIVVTLNGLHFDQYASYSGIIRAESNSTGVVEMTVDNCRFTGNVNTISNEDADSNQASSCIAFTNNASNGTLSVSNTTFSGNTSNHGAGAILFGDVVNTEPQPLGTLRIDGSIFSGNQLLSGNGGAVHGSPDYMHIKSTRFSGNTSMNRGGALYIYDHSSTTEEATRGLIENTLFDGNSSNSLGGGAIFVNHTGSITFRHSTITNNRTSNGDGAGIYFMSGSSVLENTLMVNNRSYSGQDEFVFNNSYINTTLQPVLTVNVGVIIGGEQMGESGTWPEIGYFRDAENGDYTLLSSALAVDAGVIPLEVGDQLPIDLAGMVRPYTPDPLPGGYEPAVDIGAYELQEAPDRIAPSISAVIGVFNDSEEVGSFDLTFNASDNANASGIASVIVSHEEGYVGDASPNGNATNSWSISISANDLLGENEALVQGQTYAFTIMVTDGAGNSAQDTLSVRVPLPNDNCAGAIVLRPQTVLEVPLQFAVPDAHALDDSCDGTDTGYGTLWYSVTGTGGEMNVMLSKFFVENVIEIYSGDGCSNLTCEDVLKEDFGDLQKVSFAAIEEQDYFIRVSVDLNQDNEETDSRKLFAYTDRTYVVSAADDGAEQTIPAMGTFERALHDVQYNAYDDIVFDPSLSGQVLDIHGGDYTVDRSLAIAGLTDETGAPDVTITSDSQLNLLLIEGTNATPIRVTMSGLMFSEYNSASGIIRARSSSTDIVYLNVDNCTFNDNTNTDTNDKSTTCIGFISSSEVTGMLTLNNSTFSNNRSLAPNGGILNLVATDFEINSSRFYANSSTLNGGAIDAFSTPFVGEPRGHITNSSFCKNSSNSFGGAVNIERVDLMMLHCTITDNFTTSPLPSSAAITNTSGNLTLHNTLVVNNYKVDEISNVYPIPEAPGNGVIIGGIEQGDGSTWPETGYFTDPENDNYTLQGNSLAVDAGDNSLSTALTTDLAGNVRPYDPNDESYIPRVDVGAYELQGMPDYEAPQISSDQSFTYFENQAACYVIGQVIATDNTQVTAFGISSGNQEFLFAIDEEGILTLTEAGLSGASNDFEEEPNSFTLGIIAIDAAGNNSRETSIILNLTDLEEVPPVVIENQTFEYSENQGLADVLGTVAASDNVGVTSFDITSGNEDSFFAINTNGDLILTAGGLSGASNDFEAEPNSFTLAITASDAAGNTSSEVYIELEVTNENEAPTSLNLSATSIAENQPLGTVVGLLSTSDPDMGEAFTYSLSGEDATFFEVSTNNELVTNGVLDFESRASYTVEITTTDTDGLSATISFTITVTDENETPVAINLSSTSIAENRPAGIVVGTLSTIDQDAGDTFIYALSGVDADNFAVSENNELLANASFDFETQSSYIIEVTATDAGGLTTTANFTITVTDVDDEVPVVSVGQTLTYSENRESGSELGRIEATDNVGVTGYTITSGNDGDLFQIDNSGMLTLTASGATGASNDFETEPNSFTLVFTANDAVGNTSIEENVTLIVTDVDDQVTGISEDDLVVLNVYPNPVDQKLVVTSTGNNPLHLKLTDLSGRDIKMNFSMTSQNEFEADFSKLDNGVYLLHLNSGNGKEIVRRISVLR